MPEGAVALAIVVDDETAVRDVVELLLRREGLEVMSAGSSEELRQLLDSTDLKPTLLVTDVRVGPDHGADIARRFREDYPDATIMLMSGMSPPDGLDAGFVFIAKPFSPKEFRAVLHAAMA